MSLIRSLSIYGLLLHEILSRKGDVFKRTLTGVLDEIDQEYLE